MTERVLVIKEEHLAMVFDEWIKRYEAAPEGFLEGYSNSYGENSAEYVFDLAKEMGYAQY